MASPALVNRVRGEFIEMPGLELTMAEAARLWGLDNAACRHVVEALVATPYASGLAALVDDEAHLGVACIDFGGATTTVAVFADGHPV